jgi:hypothetical protein
MIFFDLDGVLRDLCKAASINPTEWDCTIDGRSFIDYFSDNLHLLAEAPTTEYYNPLRMYFGEDLFIMTSQEDRWKKPTVSWLRKHLPKSPIAFIHDKLRFLRESDWLVEDNPNLVDYSKIILVDRPYNQGVDAPCRVKNPDELIAAIQERGY